MTTTPRNGGKNTSGPTRSVVNGKPRNSAITWMMTTRLPRDGPDPSATRTDGSLWERALPAKGSEAPGKVSGIPPAGFAGLSRARPARTEPAPRFVAILAARWPDGIPLMPLSRRFGRIFSRNFFPGEAPWPTSTPNTGEEHFESGQILDYLQETYAR